MAFDPGAYIDDIEARAERVKKLYGANPVIDLANEIIPIARASALDLFLALENLNQALTALENARR